MIEIICKKLNDQLVAQTEFNHPLNLINRSSEIQINRSYFRSKSGLVIQFVGFYGL